MKNLLLFLLACCLCAAASARPIRGSVKCGGKPMGGVTVTDGYTFAQSDEQGKMCIRDRSTYVSNPGKIRWKNTPTTTEPGSHALPGGKSAKKTPDVYKRQGYAEVQCR